MRSSNKQGYSWSSTSAPILMHVLTTLWDRACIWCFLLCCTVVLCWAVTCCSVLCCVVLCCVVFISRFLVLFVSFGLCCVAVVCFCLCLFLFMFGKHSVTNAITCPSPFFGQCYFGMLFCWFVLLWFWYLWFLVGCWFILVSWCRLSSLPAVVVCTCCCLSVFQLWAWVRVRPE